MNLDLELEFRLYMSSCHDLTLQPIERVMHRPKLGTIATSMSSDVGDTVTNSMGLEFIMQPPMVWVLHLSPVFQLPLYIYFFLFVIYCYNG
jgi:hypothetical protein